VIAATSGVLANSRSFQVPGEDRTFDVALVLGGGNALGAYQAGAYEALHDHGLLPDRVVGASAGSINGAIICGNPVEHRVAKLRAWWNPGLEGAARAANGGMFDEARRTAVALWTFATGKTGLFAPRHVFGPMWNPFGNDEPASLYDTTPLRQSLPGVIDFDLLNNGVPHFSATAVDIETGEDVIFDAGDHHITPDHLRASSALLPAFPSVEIDGRLLADAGVSANLPLDVVLQTPPDRPLLCIALDLLPLRGTRPQTLGETVTRMQDLMFATQSRRAIAAWQAIYGERVRAGSPAQVTLLHIAYSGEGREVSGKAFDFSPESAAARWRSGYQDVTRALAALPAGELGVRAPGLSVFTLSGEVRDLGRVEWQLAPTKFSGRSDAAAPAMQPA
jgi:NTE family protein